METLILLATTAFAAPPSTTLVGERGEISWSVAENDDGVTIRGAGPGWTVVHTAAADLAPVKTTRVTADGSSSTVEYFGWGARVTQGKRSSRYVTRDLWDTDTIDLRLAAFALSGEATLEFRAIDLADGRVYPFRAKRAGESLCGQGHCDRVKLEVRGLPTSVVPSWEFQYAQDGTLVKMSGASGAFAYVRPADPVLLTAPAAGSPSPDGS